MTLAGLGNWKAKGKKMFGACAKGYPYPRRTLEKIYDNACAKAGIQRRGGRHSLRRSYATHLLEQGTLTQLCDAAKK